ncbi:hypothetical protein DY000_02022841 [Brassica cretica]|uniref:ABC transmembrane type-1 domain-containing protein n=1 Tax=Brassica cretica TaxID=69181 RepID=A0ABQ7EEE9_BRACR|nr:hypothetical protein DY000_02022841 [Brassica cretica]
MEGSPYQMFSISWKGARFQGPNSGFLLAGTWSVPLSGIRGSGSGLEAGGNDTGVFFSNRKSECRSTKLLFGSTVVDENRATNCCCCRLMRSVFLCGLNVPNLHGLMRIAIEFPCFLWFVSKVIARLIDWSFGTYMNVARLRAFIQGEMQAIAYVYNS